MLKIPIHAVVLLLTAICLSLTACTAQTTLTPTATATAAPSATATLPPTASSTPLPLPTETASPTQTSTPDPNAVRWLVPAEELLDWPQELSQLSWANEHTFTLKISYDPAAYVQYDLTSRPVAKMPATPEPLFHNAEQENISFSPNGTFAVLCFEDGLQLYRVEEDQLISKTDLVIALYCSWSVRWTSDESALSFVSEAPEGQEEELFPYPIYVWKTDGSSPYVVGHGTRPDEPGTWSPDSSRLTLEIYNFEATIPEDEYTYFILFADGRPPLKTKAQLGSRAMPGVSWLTNDIVYEFNTCCGTCSITSYYVANTGKKIEELSWDSCWTSLGIDNQKPMVSEDQHWFVLDQSSQDHSEPEETALFAYTLYNLQSRRSYPLSQSDEIFLDFLGWVDNSTFYLIRRPVNDQIQAKPNEPFGLLALDPNTRQMRLINGDIRYAWLSPDKQNILGATRTGNQLFAALYTIEGEALTKPAQLPLLEPDFMPDVPKLGSVWEIPDYFEFLDWAWTADWQTVAVRAGGVAWLLNVDGSIQKLAENLTSPENHVSYYEGYKRANTNDLIWSPGGNYLLVPSGTQAWVIPLK